MSYIISGNRAYKLGHESTFATKPKKTSLPSSFFPAYYKLFIKMMMMMIMIAGFVDSITTPIKTWLDKVLNTHDHQNTTSSFGVKELGVGSSRVDCIVCLSEVVLGESFAMLERCRHGFHVECVEAWLKDHSNCPLCRTPITSGVHDQDTQKHIVYLKKLYEMMSSYGFLALEIMAEWLTNSFSQDLHSNLSESCSYL